MFGTISSIANKNIWSINNYQVIPASAMVALWISLIPRAICIFIEYSFLICFSHVTQDDLHRNHEIH